MFKDLKHTSHFKINQNGGALMLEALVVIIFNPYSYYFFPI